MSRETIAAMEPGEMATRLLELFEDSDTPAREEAYQFLLAWVRTPIFPLADAATVHALGGGYGRVRALGSLGYVAMVVGAGAVRDVYPLAPLLLGGLLLLGAAALVGALPPIPKERSSPELRTLLNHLFRGPTAIVLLVALSLWGLLQLAPSPPPVMW